MSQQKAIELLYEMAEDITTANGFNYDWKLLKGGDRFLTARDRTPCVTITIGDEDNADDIGAIGSGQYIDTLKINFDIKVPIMEANVPSSDVMYQQQIDMAKAVDDIKKRYSTGRYLCSNGFAELRSLRYIKTRNDIVETEQKLSIGRRSLEFELKYVTERVFFDG